LCNFSQSPCPHSTRLHSNSLNVCISHFIVLPISQKQKKKKKSFYDPFPHFPLNFHYLSPFPSHLNNLQEKCSPIFMGIWTNDHHQNAAAPAAAAICHDHDRVSVFFK
jgi:hypothetical protein